MTLCLAVLFFVLTPGILLRLPKGGSKMMVAATHAVVFVLVFQLMHKMGWKAYEGFQAIQTKTGGGSASGGMGVKGANTGNAKATLSATCPAGQKKVSGVCVKA